MKFPSSRLSVFLAFLFAATAQAQQPASSPVSPRKVACVGDSITFGSGAEPGKSYPSQLQALLGDKWQVGNFGVSGRTLLKKGDFPYWNEKAFKAAQAFAPDAVIIMLGTNDTKPQNWKYRSEFTSDYRELVKTFLDLPSKPKVFICRPCPVTPPGNYGINETNVQHEIPQIDALAREMNLGVIDMHAALRSNPKLLPDHVHPNTQGAALMARAAYEALTGSQAPR